MKKSLGQTIHGRLVLSELHRLKELEAMRKATAAAVLRAKGRPVLSVVAK